MNAAANDAVDSLSPTVTATHGPEGTDLPMRVHSIMAEIEAEISG
jgi:hypothetical protein